MYVKDGVSTLHRVLLSPPDYLEAAPINEIALKWQDTSLDKKMMAEEFQSVVESYHKAGVKTEFLESDKERPNSVFARDFGGCVREGYILGRFKLDMRRKEHEDYKKKMESLGIPCIAEVKDGIFEGGDFVFLRENLIALGMADRTNEKGAMEVKKALQKYGYKVISVPLKREYLHMDMCFNLVDENLAVAYYEGLPEEFRKLLTKLDIDVIKVPEEAIFLHGCNLEALGDHRVLSLARNHEVNEALSHHGMDVIELPVTEILKAGGGPHCMTFPLERG